MQIAWRSVQFLSQNLWTRIYSSALDKIKTAPDLCVQIAR